MYTAISERVEELRAPRRPGESPADARTRHAAYAALHTEGLA